MALDCDGVDDQVDHGDIAGIDSGAVLTVMCWANVDTVPTIETAYVGKVVAGTPYVFLFGPTTDNKVMFLAGAAGSANGKSPALTQTNGVDEHWAVVYDGAGAANADKVKMYKNGIDQTLTFTGTFPATLADGGTEPVYAARDSRGSVFLNGRVSHIKLWLAALTAAEVAQEFNSYRPVRTANLSLWAPYDDGTSARDYSGAGNHGTVTGALQVPGPPVSYGG